MWCVYYEEYYENGQLKAKGNYKDGLDDGLYEAYYENGQLQEKGNFKDGKPDGLYEAYKKNGAFWFKQNFKDGGLGYRRMSKELNRLGYKVRWEKSFILR